MAGLLSAWQDREMSFADVPDGRQWIGPRGSRPRHRHALAYAAVVLRGGYLEAGPNGRFQVREGDVLFHAAFEGHADFFGARTTEIVNLPLPFDPPCAAASLTGDELCLSNLRPLGAELGDWPDLLARDLRREPSLPLAGWALSHGLRPETLSRGFFRCFGTTPARFRAELRAHRAWAMLRTGTSLAGVAAATGFCDQAHFTRNIVRLTGQTPAAWRNQFRSRRRPA